MFCNHNNTYEIPHVPRLRRHTLVAVSAHNILYDYVINYFKRCIICITMELLSNSAAIVLRF